MRTSAQKNEEKKKMRKKYNLCFLTMELDTVGIERYVRVSEK